MRENLMAPEEIVSGNSFGNRIRQENSHKAYQISKLSLV